MVIDVSKIEDSVLPFEFTVSPEKLDLDVANFRLAGAVTVSGEVIKHIGSVSVKGSIAGEAEIDCTRCLIPIKRPLAVNFDVDYLTEGGLGANGEFELQTGDLTTDELKGDQLNLIELAREQILLEIPEQTYCTEDCKGLCEKCGENLNLIDCNCGQDEIDPRWAALKNLK